MVKAGDLMSVERKTISMVFQYYQIFKSSLEDLETLDGWPEKVKTMQKTDWQIIWMELKLK